MATDVAPIDLVSVPTPRVSTYAVAMPKDVPHGLPLAMRMELEILMLSVVADMGNAICAHQMAVDWDQVMSVPAPTVSGRQVDTTCPNICVVLGTLHIIVAV